MSVLLVSMSIALLFLFFVVVLIIMSRKEAVDITDSESEYGDVDRDLSEYVYKKLSGDNSIRLLKLLPGSPENKEIVCELVEHILTLEDSPKRVEQGSDKQNGQSTGPDVKITPEEADALYDKEQAGSSHTGKTNHSRESPAGHLGVNYGERGLVRKKGHAHTKSEVSERSSAEENQNGEKLPRYEALSWAWGDSPWDHKINIREGNEDFWFHISPSLIAALTALRNRKRVRTLWVDAICINQNAPDEKNRQVPMMSMIYGRAKSVCIWLGEADEDSKLALDFISNEVLKLQHFDELCDDQKASPKWRAMLNLMKRPWFSRRWVVQEIALSNRAKIYCGEDNIPWKDFSDAVQLFVEVETATHRLSEVMRKDKQFYHVPGWFEYVSALGASVLVNATGTLFRVSRDQPLLSLEYLVSNLSVFAASEPRDTIYSLLAVAKDAMPMAVRKDGREKKESQGLQLLNRWLTKHKRRKPFPVDYEQPYVDVCKLFIEFSIKQAEPSRALDIICRPWAPPPSEKSLFSKTKPREAPEDTAVPLEVLPSWVPKLEGAAFSMYVHPNSELKMGRQNADSLVGLPGPGQLYYTAANNAPIRDQVWKFKKRDSYFSMYVSGFILDEVASIAELSQSGNIPVEWVMTATWSNLKKDPPEEFWRTLVADRGRHGRNPPTYYARACKESINKGLSSGALNTTELINEGRCSVVSEFFRRVQAVIWNRRLMKTKSGRLGIVRKEVRVGDLICIFHGCSVPVILRRYKKSPAAIEQERIDDDKDLELAVVKMQRLFRENLESRKTRESVKTTRASTKRKLREGRSDTWPQGMGRKLTGAIADEHKIQPTTSASAERGQNVDDEDGNINVEPAGGPSNKTAVDPSNQAPGFKTGPTETAQGQQPNGAKEELEIPKEKEKEFYFEFLNEAFVYGMMDGDAIRYQNEQDIKPQVFELR